jgi:hypothetical protein
LVEAGALVQILWWWQTGLDQQWQPEQQLREKPL